MYHAPSHYRLLSHTTMPMHDKTVIDESHPIIIFKQNFILLVNQNLFGCHILMTTFFYKITCLLWVANFRGLIAGFHRWTLSRVSIPTCYYPTHIFMFLQQCDSIELQSTVPTHSSTHQVWCLIAIMHLHP